MTTLAEAALAVEVASLAYEDALRGYATAYETRNGDAIGRAQARLDDAGGLLADARVAYQLVAFNDDQRRRLAAIVEQHGVMRYLTNGGGSGIRS